MNMSVRQVLFTLMLFPSVLVAQGANVPEASALKAPTTFPIVFMKTVSAANSRAGDMVVAKTQQAVQLANGTVVPSGTKVTGHVVAADKFSFDATLYAHQKAATLSVRFDSMEVAGRQVPLNVTVRAMASPVVSWDARKAGPSDMDSQATVMQVGGDKLVPSQAEVRNMDGDIVAYNKRNGVYAHLIASGRCDGSDVEVSVGIYSASACGLYGFANVTASEFGSSNTPSVLTLASSRTSPQIWKHSTALLEVIPSLQSVASR
jgi:hypothetical protein